MVKLMQDQATALEREFEETETVAPPEELEWALRQCELEDD